MLEKSRYITLALPYWDIKGNYFSEGKIMKLAKKLIVSGLLFSSILGGVNVSSITAKADFHLNEIPNVGSQITYNPNGNSIEKRKVIIKYLIDGVPVVNSGFQDSIYLDAKKNTINLNELNINLNDYSISENMTQITVSTDNIATINLNTKKKEIALIFKGENGEVISVPFGKVTVPVRNKTLNAKNIVVPEGYELVANQNLMIDTNRDVEYVIVKIKKISTINNPTKPSIKPSVKPSKRPSAPRYTIQRVRITFVDQNSKDLVGYKQVTGKASFSTKIEAPKGYSFTNAKDATIKFDKKGNKDIKIFVKKMTSAPVKHEDIITTTNGSYKRLYTLEGKMITNRALSVNSKWYTDQYATVNGEKMYRVATNEWVKASDVL